MAWSLCSFWNPFLIHRMPFDSSLSLTYHSQSENPYDKKVPRCQRYVWWVKPGNSQTPTQPLAHSPLPQDGEKTGGRQEDLWIEFQKPWDRQDLLNAHSFLSFVHKKKAVERRCIGDSQVSPVDAVLPSACITVSLRAMCKQFQIATTASESSIVYKSCVIQGFQPFVFCWPQHFKSEGNEISPGVSTPC